MYELATFLPKRGPNRPHGTPFAGVHGENHPPFWDLSAIGIYWSCGPKLRICRVPKTRTLCKSQEVQF